MGVELIEGMLDPAPESLALVRSYLEGNCAAGEALAGLVRNILYRRLRRMTTSKEAADELVQDCMLQVFARLPEYSPEKGVFEAWIGGFALNAYRSNRRREVRARYTMMPVEDIQELSYDINDLEDERDLLVTALNTLELLDRELLHMRFSLGMSSDEIATSSDLNAPQVRKRISRAVERLRRHPSVRQILV